MRLACEKRKDLVLHRRAWAAFSSCGFYSSAAYMQLEFGKSAASIRVRLLIKCSFYTRLYGINFS